MVCTGRVGESVLRRQWNHGRSGAAGVLWTQNVFADVPRQRCSRPRLPRFQYQFHRLWCAPGGWGNQCFADNGTTVVQARPEFYGLKMFSLMCQGSVVPAPVSLGSNINFTAYGVHREGGGISASPTMEPRSFRRGRSFMDSKCFR